MQPSHVRNGTKSAPRDGARATSRTQNVSTLPRHSNIFFVALRARSLSLCLVLVLQMCCTISVFAVELAPLLHSVLGAQHAAAAPVLCSLGISADGERARLSNNPNALSAQMRHVWHDDKTHLRKTPSHPPYRSPFVRLLCVLCALCSVLRSLSE